MKHRLIRNKILFIDDSQIEISYLKLFFEITDLPVETSFINSAQQALELLAIQSANEFPDVIIVDINMPLMTGFEFAEKYLERFKDMYPNTLLFIYSTSIHSTDIKRAESIAGVSGFIPKPFMDQTFERYIAPHLNSLNRLEANNN